MLKKFRSLKIRFKIALLLNIFSLIIIGLVSVVLTQQFKRSLQDRILLQLSSIRHLKTIQIEQMLANHRHEIETMLMHINDREYLDALAADQFIHIDSIVINNELMEANDIHPDSVSIHDYSAIVADGQVHLAYNIPYDSLIYTFYSTPTNIQNILFERTGMGETGETYIVGNDGFLRTQSRFLTDTLPTSIQSDTKAFSAALNTGAGLMKHKDYRGIEVFSSYAPFQYFGLQWVVLSEIDVDEALLPLKEMERRIYIVAAIIAMGIFLISNFLAWMIVNPVVKVQEALRHIARGEKAAIPRYHSQDEIGALFNTLGSFITVSDEIIQFANNISNGQLDTNMVLRGPNDSLVKSLNHMKTQLIEIQEREREVQIKSQRLLMAGEEKERGRLSRELHDSIGPLLTNLKLMLGQEDITRADVEVMVKHIVDEVRKISVNLMPSVLKDFGLVAAVQSFLAQLPKTPDCEILFSNDSESPTKLSHDLSLNAFRIIQEAIHNAIKHAGARRIKLSITEFDDQINIFVADDGKGFDPQHVQFGNGLLNMKERVNMFGGRWDLQSSEEGTIIEIEFKTSNY